MKVPKSYARGVIGAGGRCQMSWSKAEMDRALEELELTGELAATLSSTQRREQANAIAKLVEKHLWAEHCRQREEAQEAARLLEQEKAQAYRDEVERFFRDRLDLEPFSVGDEQAGISSPYEVQMTPAETALLKAVSSRFDPSCLLVDTYLDKGDGTTTQIDIIAICRQGVIVIESKGYSGTISGKTGDAEWTHQSSQRRIYNPIRQNELHVDSVYRLLEPAETEAPHDVF